MSCPLWRACALACLVGCGNTDETLLLDRVNASNLPEAAEASASDETVDDRVADDEPVNGGDGADVEELEPAVQVDPGADPLEPVADVAPVIPVQPAEAGPVVPPDLCVRLEPDTFGALGVAIEAVLTSQLTECSTARLLEGADDGQILLWADYLFRYTQVLLGCADAEVPASGMEVFALANTAEEGVGIALRPLGRDDTENLIRQYLDQLHLQLSFSTSERVSFEGYLRQRADEVVVPELSGALSTCTEPL